MVDCLKAGRFLQSVRDGHTVDDAAMMAEVSASAVYRRRAWDVPFDLAVRAAIISRPRRKPVERWRTGCGRYREMGAVVRRVRKDAGLTQRELAQRVGCSYTMISKVEHGVRRLSNDAVEKAARVLGVAAVVLRAEPMD